MEKIRFHLFKEKMRMLPEQKLPFYNFVSNIVIITMLIISIGYIVIGNEYEDFVKSSQQIEKELFNEYQKKLRTEVNRVVDYINYYKSLSEYRLKNDIKNRVHQAYTIALAIYLKYKNKEPIEKVKERIIDALTPLRWSNGSSFIWIIDTNGTAILFPINKSIENKSVIDYHDANGRYIVKEAITLTKQKNEGFLEKIYVKRPKDRTRLNEQIAFVKLFQPFDWIIGTGETIDEVEKNIKEEILKRISSMRFNKDGYFGVIDQYGTVLTHPFIPPGTNIYNLNNPRYKQILAKLIRSADEDKFVQYYFKKLSEDKIAKKLVYAQRVPDWNWIVFSGIYLDEIQKKIQQRKEELKTELSHRVTLLLLLFGSFSIVALLVSFYFSQKLHEIFKEYRKKIEYRTKRLEKLNLALKEKERQALAANRAKTLFISNISHDIRTPLNAILGYTQLLLQDHTLTTPQRNRIERILKHGRLLTELLDEIIEISKIESGNIELNEENFDIKTFLENIEDLYFETARQKKITWKVEGIPKKETFVKGDKKKLFRVLVNLISNAFKFTDKGTIILKFEPLGAHKYRFSVEDTGIGIEKNFQEAIFNSFTQTKIGAKRGGKGLGLAIASNYVNIMGGKLNLQSTPKHGSRFFFEISLPPALPTKKATYQRREHNKENVKDIKLNIDKEKVKKILSHIEIGNITLLKNEINSIKDRQTRSILMEYLINFDLAGLEKLIKEAT